MPHHLDGSCEVLEDVRKPSHVRKRTDKAVTWYRTVEVAAEPYDRSDN